ncbi:MAG: hypothetical protein P8130_03770 [Deltaproteobacteria bacterium]
MKLFKVLLAGALLLLTYVPAANASDFAWISDFNIQAQADPSGFKANLETRFHIGNLEVNTVLNNFDNPSDAYIALRLGEMSNKPVTEVIRKYKRNKGQGWGKLAQSLGIKPGSAEFHALKQGDDLHGGHSHHAKKAHGKGHGGNSKGHGKGGKNKKW